MTDLAPSAPEPTKRILVYFLAAPADQDICEAIRKHLSPIVRNSKILIEVNSDLNIPPGEDTEGYKNRLLEANIVLAFISADFINSDDIYARLQRVLDRYNHKETTLMPILVRNCLWKLTIFAQLPLLPKNLQPLNNKQFWNSEDDAVVSVVSDLYDSINEFIAKASKSETGVAAPIEKDWRRKYYMSVFWKRAAAYIIDFVVLGIIPSLIVGIFIALGIMISDKSSFDEDPTANMLGSVYAANIVLSIPIFLLVCPIMESSRWRGTIGKLIMQNWLL
jgi:RDD family